MPAADTDRIQVAQLLTDAAAQGRLDMSEYEDRLKKAYAAQTFDELDRLSAELLGIAATAPGVGPGRSAPSTLLLAIMSGFRAARRAERAAAVDVGRLLRRRRDRPALRRLHLGRRGIHSYSICGGQTILVPPEVNVDLRGVGVMGSFDNSSIGAGAQGAPCGHHPRLLTVGQRRREAQEAPGTVPPRSTQPWIELFWTKAER
jgi:uncharacterized protein DUF1707